MRQKSAFPLHVTVRFRPLKASQAACVNMIGTSPVLIDPTKKTTVADEATQWQRQTRENYVAKAINSNQKYTFNGPFSKRPPLEGAESPLDLPEVPSRREAADWK